MHAYIGELKPGDVFLHSNVSGYRRERYVVTAVANKRRVVAHRAVRGNVPGRRPTDVFTFHRQCLVEKLPPSRVHRAKS